MGSGSRNRTARKNLDRNFKIGVESLLPGSKFFGNHGRNNLPAQVMHNKFEMVIFRCNENV